MFIYPFDSKEPHHIRQETGTRRNIKVFIVEKGLREGGELFSPIMRYRVSTKKLSGFQRQGGGVLFSASPGGFRLRCRKNPG
jgi:hypothetical protein